MKKLVDGFVVAVSLAAITYTILPRRSNGADIVASMGQAQASMIKAMLPPQPKGMRERVMETQGLTDADRMWLQCMMDASED